NLFLTQSAVSARIRLLEDLLGTPLFTRARNNVQLTPQGKRLVRHAETILNAWTRAKQEVAVSNESNMSLSVGGIASLWDILLQDWLVALNATFPGLSLTAEVLSNDLLVRRIRDRTLDLAFSFEAPQLSEVKVEEIADISLIMVTSHPGLDCQQAQSHGDYVLVDWGTGFAIAHAQAFPEIDPPRLRFGLGRLAHAFVLERGGSLYLPQPVVDNDLAAGRLHRVSGAPVMKRSAYAFFGADANRNGLIDRVLQVGFSATSVPS
ncbi:MAG: LysR family transcriptional regulator, partial [Chromatiaceae bacterium]|nr:LysR family transcriptional regulator [Chromatiaceae bacterium]